MELKRYKRQLSEDTIYKSKYRDTDILNESIKKTYIIRNGKRVVKYRTDKKGYKIQMVDGRPREVKMTTSEIRKRKVGRKKASRKPTKSSTITKRKKSTKKHTW